MRRDLRDLAFLLLVGTTAAGQLPAQDGRRIEALPDGDVFQPLLADPKQPHFFASLLWIDSPLLTGPVGSVGLGEDIGLVRGPGGRWQVSIAAGAFSQFQMDTPSNDLINTDFVVGLPVAYRWGPLWARLRLYHQSSHLGDEFILNGNPERVNLSFEAAELLLSGHLAGFRVYGGGEYIFRREPEALRPGLLHGGLEYRGPWKAMPARALGDARLIVALDAKSTQERGWRVGWSGRVGLELRPTVVGAFRSFSLQLHAYDGPSPYGQFYQSGVRSAGIGVHFSL